MSQPSESKFRGENLRIARTLHGLTVVELGDKINASRQYIQKLETDPRVLPNNRIEAALAELLYVKPSFFHDTEIAILNEDICRFRKRKTTTKRDRNRALSSGAIFNNVIKFFDQLFEIPPVSIPYAHATTRNQIERTAMKVRMHFGIGTGTPVGNMVRVLECHGVIVTKFEGVSDKVDAFSYVNERPVVVINPAKNSPSRTRFDLAHELGHIVLHDGIEGEDGDIEEQANMFASAFLLPGAAFFREFSRHKNIVWEKLLEMKQRWGVSLQALIRRAYDLNILTAVQYRNAYIYIGRRGWRTAEPCEDRIPMERPELIPLFCTALFEEDEDAHYKIASALKVEPSILTVFGLPVPEQHDNPRSNSTVISIKQLQKMRGSNRTGV